MGNANLSLEINYLVDDSQLPQLMHISQVVEIVPKIYVGNDRWYKGFLKKQSILLEIPDRSL